MSLSFAKIWFYLFSYFNLPIFKFSFQKQSVSLHGRLFSNQSELFESFLNCFDYWIKAVLQKGTFYG